MAQNAGTNPNAAAGAQGPAAMDVASVIATVTDPDLRREMLGNLDDAQLDSLPANLRAEAVALREEQRR